MGNYEIDETTAPVERTSVPLNVRQLVDDFELIRLLRRRASNERYNDKFGEADETEKVVSNMLAVMALDARMAL